MTTALAVSGLPADRFCFEGFAPRKQLGAQDVAGGAWPPSSAPCVFFESPRRLADCLRDAVEALGGERRAVVCRELTKTHEEVVRGTLAELAEWAADGVLGEITVVLAGAAADAPTSATLVAEVNALVDDGTRVKDACAAGDRGASGRAVAARALRCGSAVARLTGGAMALPASGARARWRPRRRLLGPHRRRNPPAGTGSRLCSPSTCPADGGSPET